MTRNEIFSTMTTAQIYKVQAAAKEAADRHERTTRNSSVVSTRP